MRWSWLIVFGLLGCGGGDYAGALVTAGAAVGATALYRQATNGCWGNCSTGEACDEESGLCVAAPCRASCRADHRCMWVDGSETCVAPRRAAADELTPVESQARQTPKKTNHALCLLAGLLDCPPAAPIAASTSPTTDPEVDIVAGL